jgi:hypothetical protein
MTAALLPLTFMWLCAACAFICGQEAAEHSLAGPAAALTQVRDAPRCEGCPFATFPKAKAPERAAFDAGPQTAAADVPTAPPTCCTAVAGLVRPRAQAPTTQPLQLLPTLRI